MKKLMVVSMAAVAALSLTACGGGGRSAARMEKMAELRLEDALDRIDATPQQRARAQQLMKQVLTDAAPLAKQGQQTREALLEQWRSPTVDSARVHSLVNAQLDAVRVFADQAVDVAIEVHDLLTPQQREHVTRRIEALHR